MFKNKPTEHSMVTDTLEGPQSPVASTSTASFVSLEPLDADDELDEAKQSTCSAAKTTITSKSCRQASITEAFSVIKSFSGGTKSSKITNAILFMIAKDNMPLNTPEKEGFKFLMKTVAPLYQLPGRKKITQLIDEKYDVLAGMYKQKLSHISNITLTTDIWTETMTVTSFLGITGHFLDENKLNSVTIGVTELNQSHTSQYLGERISSVCDEWNISPLNVTAVVTDNGANVVKAVSDIIFGKNRHLSCFAHTLDLVASKITDNVESVKIVIEKVKAIVTYFKQSVSAAGELRKAQPQNALKLIQSVPTRWNSKFYMLERFVKLYQYVAPILLKNPKSPAMISASDLETVKEVLNILASIEAVSKEMCGEIYITSSKVIPIVNCLLKTLEKLSSSTAEGLALKTTTMNELLKRFGIIEQIDLLAVSTILDPRFKRLHFNSPISCANAVTFLNNSIQLRKQEKNDNAHQIQVADIVNVNPDSVWAYHEELAIKCSEKQDDWTKGDLDFDLKMYLNSPTIPLNSDPFLYWSSNSCSPILRELANKYLSVVGTSVPSERLFSEDGNIITQSRNRLKGNRLSKLLFLHSLSFDGWNL